MSVDRHRRLEELFHAALDLPAAERAAFLAEACGDDADLRAEVTELIARDEAPTADPFLGGPPLAPPERIGPFQILHVIGEGGFAMVYLAQQEEPLRRQVALKVLKPGLDTRATLARFETERQALAVMNHVGIARIYDAGATEQGRPYFVLEFVDGEPITEYCDRRELDNRARLELFATVCDAVHHAHQKGVIHRDLKPSNILVTKEDGRPQPKVIDFGIAKATTPEIADRTLVTQDGQIIGTPEYMSPEQAGFGPGDVDTRTDIYSLGVVLYELLTGVPPFSRETLRQAGFAEIQRIIREVDPPRPSTRLGTLGDDSIQVARRRRAEPRTLVRQLRGDLDWVVLKAMEKDRERRYGSPAELARDIQGHLRDEPLLARPPSAVYRLRKFSRRNKVALGMTAALVLGLVGLSTGVTIALVEANRQQERLTAALTDTQQARDEADAVTDFLTDMLGAAQPYAGGRDVTVRAVLDSTAAGLDAALGDRPLVATRVRRTIGVTYTELGLFAAAESLLKRARVDHEHLLGPDHPQSLRSAAELGDLYLKQDRHQDAAEIYRDLVERHRRVHGPAHALTLAAMNQLGITLEDLNRYADAETLLVRCWEFAQESLDPDSPTYLTYASNLANLYGETGRPAAAEPLLREVLASRIRMRGEDHPEVQEAWNNLAMVYADNGRYQECIPFLARAHELQDRALGPGHPEALLARNNLAAMHAQVFDWVAAETLYTTGVRLARAQRGGGERVTQHLINNLGYLYLQSGRFDAAATLLQEAHALRLANHGPRHRDTCSSVNNLGELALVQGDLRRADQLLTGNLTVRREILGADHQHTLASLVNLGWLRLAQGKPDAADSLLTAAFDLARRTLGYRHRSTLVAACHLGRARLATGRYGDVATMLQPLVAIADSVLVQRDPLRGAMRSQLAACALRDGRRDEAAALLATAEPLLDARLTAATPWRHDDLAVRAALLRAGS